MATQNEILQVRRRVGDKVKTSTESYEYAGSNAMKLKHQNIYGVTVQLNDAPLAATSYTLDGPEGIVTLNSGVAAQDDVLRFEYSYAAYTDAEINLLIDTYGERGAVVEIINDLLADSARMFDYSEGGTEMKQSQIFKNLERLLKLYQNDDGSIKEEQAGTGGFAVMHRDFGSNRPVPEFDISRSDC